MKMILLAMLALAPLPALAQSAPPTKLYTAGSDIPGLIAEAKANQKSPHVNSVEPLAILAPYRVQLEYRTGLTPPTVHHGQAELIYVIQGHASLATGGHLIGIRPPRPGSTTDSGTGISGASHRELSPGDYVMVPPETAHQFQDIKGEFVIMSVHLPMPQSK